LGAARSRDSDRAVGRGAQLDAGSSPPAIFRRIVGAERRSSTAASLTVK
jgi:hypothetical protein